MPKTASQKSAIEKTKKYIRNAFVKNLSELKFTSYESKNTIIYKLNKFHYLDKELYVMNTEAIEYLVGQAQKNNYIELLDFELCNIGDEGLRALARGKWQNVRFLNLGSNKLTCQGIAHLVNAKCNQLRRLQLQNNDLKADSCLPLSQCSWPDLQCLKLNFNNLTDLGIKQLANNDWYHLKELHLLRNNLTNQSMASLIKFPTNYLEEIYLSNNFITNDGIKNLLKCQWRLLKVFEIDGNLLNQEALPYFSRLKCYKLERLLIFASRTVVFNNNDKTVGITTMSGTKWFVKSQLSSLKLQIRSGMMGQMRNNFIHNKKLKQMLTNVIGSIVLQ